MGNIYSRSNATKSSGLDTVSCDELSAGVDGEVLFQEMDGFEGARMSVWNLDTAGMPAVIVKCISTGDVEKAIKFAKRNNLGVCVHTAGAHSSQAVVDKCVVIDLSSLRSVTVDASTRTVTVAGGATIGDVDAACKPHGLALPMGHVHHTGVAGMVMAATSGFGLICRNFQLTASHLISATIITSSGVVVNASKDSNSDLLWGMRGAGANFGVAVEMVFSLEVIAPKLYAGDVVKFGKGTGPDSNLDSDETREELVLKVFEFFQSAPDQCTTLLVMAPRGPVIHRLVYCPKEHDKPQTEIEEAAMQAFEPLNSYGKVISNGCKMMDYWDEVQKLGEFSPSYYYQKGATTCDIPPSELPGLVQKLCESTEACPVVNMASGILIQPMGGQLLNLEPGSTPTAEAFKQMKWWFIVIIQFPDGAQDPDLRDRCIRWVQDVYQVLEPFALKDNGREKDSWTEAYGDIYGGNVSRLTELKNKYDPENVFCHNRNILPQQVSRRWVRGIGGHF